MWSPLKKIVVVAVVGTLTVLGIKKASAGTTPVTPPAPKPQPAPPPKPAPAPSPAPSPQPDSPSVAPPTVAQLQASSTPGYIQQGTTGIGIAAGGAQGSQDITSTVTSDSGDGDVTTDDGSSG